MNGPGDYRYHNLATAGRVFFVHLGWLYAGTYFISVYGGEFYAPLYLSASALSIVFYLFLASRSISGALSVYGLLFGITTALTLYLWQGPAISAVGIAYCVGVLLLDLVGATMAGRLLQVSVNPALFARFSQKILTCELVTRLTTSCVFFVLAEQSQLRFCFLIMLMAAAVHIFAMLKIRYSVVDQSASAADIQGLTNITKAARFIGKNPLVKFAFLIIVWTYSLKFLSETLYFQVVEKEMTDQADIGRFLSAISLSVIIVALVMKRLLTDHLTERLTPGQLFTILPAGLLVLLGVSLVVPLFLPVVCTYVYFLCVNLSLQLPTSRQCLVHVPSEIKHALVFLIFITTAAVGIGISATLSFAKDYLEPIHYIYLMILFTVPLFILLFNLDTFYVRNLWSMYRERVDGNWIDDLWASPSSGPRATFRHHCEIFDRDYWLQHQVNLAERSSKLGKAYWSYDSERLRSTVSEHKKLLASPQARDIKEGLVTMFEVGPPHAYNQIKKFCQHPNAVIAKLAVNQCRALRLLEDSNTNGLGVHSQRKLKALLLLIQPRPGCEQRQEKLGYLMNHRDRKTVAKVLDLLDYYRDSEEKFNLCWAMICEEKITVMPLVECMVERSYPRAADIRQIFFQLDLDPNFDAELQLSVATILSKLSAKYFSVWTRKAGEISWQSQCQHALFLDEFRLRAHNFASGAVIDSIGDMFEHCFEDKLVVCNMHLEVLKKSRFVFPWSTILDPQFYMQRAQFQDRTVRAFRLLESLVPEQDKSP